MGTTLIDGAGGTTDTGNNTGDTGGKTVDDATKAAADQATGDNAANAANADADKKTADAAVADKTDKTDKPRTPDGKFAEKYDLKLPEKSTVDAAVVERTAAKARELGLSNEHAQKALDFVHQEIVETSKAAAEAALKAHTPGGEVWEAQVNEWRANALADKELGGGDQAKLDAAVAIANQVVAKFADKEAVEFFKNNPIGAHPALIRMLHRIGKASSEGTLVTPGTQGGQKPLEERWYGETKAE
jgi:hypothetical protein